MNDTVRAGSKRHTPITFGADSPKHARTSISNQREIYTPPSGKYSNKVSSYSKYFGIVEAIFFWFCFLNLSLFCVFSASTGWNARNQKPWQRFWWTWQRCMETELLKAHVRKS